MPVHDSDLPTLHDDAPDTAAFAAHCFRQADQLKGGPVRDALRAMGRQYAARAREKAQTASFRWELDRSQRAASHSLLGRALEALARWFEPLVAPPPVPVVARRTAPAPVAPQRRLPPRHVPRILRINALTRPEL